MKASWKGAVTPPADHCLDCGSEISRVTETRSVPTGQLRRRRSCPECHARWTTYESRTPEQVPTLPASPTVLEMMLHAGPDR